MTTCIRLLACLIPLIVTATTTRADINIPGDTSDLALTTPGNGEVTVIDLSLAASVPWNTSSPVPGNGVYDVDQWAVVFKYSSVNVQFGDTLRFTNHPSRAPVVWLVQGNVDIDGVVDLSGEGWVEGIDFVPTEPGPGGFRGARQADRLNTNPEGHGSGGLGPGGANYPNSSGGNGAGGSYGARGENAYNASSGPTYGNSGITPLIGGSGGSSARNNTQPSSKAGAGGGAILVAARQTIRVDGAIVANGGSPSIEPCCDQAGGGSGGAIRLLADSITGSGSLQALGGSAPSEGGNGRIRIETNSSFPLTTLPAASIGFPDSVPVIWPPADAPSIRVISIDGVPVPSDPEASLEFPVADLLLNATNTVSITIDADNVPPEWDMEVRVVPRRGRHVVVQAVGSGDGTSSTWTADIDLEPSEFSTIQVRAFEP